MLDKAKAAARAQQAITDANHADHHVSKNNNLVNGIDQDAGDDGEHNVLDFGRWLFFCQRCKHGGHASCIDNWFDGDAGVGDQQQVTRRTVCGVNGCDCSCSSL